MFNNINYNKQVICMYLVLNMNCLKYYILNDKYFYYVSFKAIICVYNDIYFFQKILTHSKSRVVLQAMKEAVNANKQFEVYVTCSAPDNSGLVVYM